MFGMRHVLVVLRNMLLLSPPHFSKMCSADCNAMYRVISLSLYLMIFGVGTEWCRMCGSNSTYGNLTQSDVSTCFLAHGGLAPSGDLTDQLLAVVMYPCVVLTSNFIYGVHLVFHNI